MSKGQQTRTAILDDAIEIASKIGFGALTIGMLAEQAEMSKSGLFAHFKSKEQLQLQTLEHGRQRFVDVVLRPALTAPRGEPRVRALIDHWLRWADDTLSGGCVFAGASAELDDQPGPLRDALVRNQQDWLELIANVVQTAVAEGDFGPETDVHQFAFDFHGITLAYHHASRLMHDPAAGDRIRRSFENLLAAARA
ncbi:MAG TPA: TetR/AcrR family transcriptional regulator [Nocardioidaceae bacterium]|nr:TetR/AcrR family transcriptional regulator [Nocardioidaceae bacterium]